jgi:hypothetical protein
MNYPKFLREGNKLQVGKNVVPWVPSVKREHAYIMLGISVILIHSLPYSFHKFYLTGE